MAETYCSCDVEADGHVPGVYSMLSFGCAAFDIEKNLLGTFGRNLHLLPDARPDADTMQWWASQPEAWAACRRDLVDPAVAMGEFVAFLEALPGKKIFVGFPGTYDFMWIHWYLHRFVGRSPMGFGGLCMKSYAAAVMKSKRFADSTKRAFAKRGWMDDMPHTHVGLDDAIEQGAMAVNILRENLGLERVEGIRGSGIPATLT